MSGRHWAEVQESTFVAGIWLLYWLHRLAGRWPFRLCIYPVVFVYWLLRPAARTASLQYLQRLQAATGALGRRPRRLDTLRHFARFAETLLDKLLAVSGRYPLEQVHVEGREAVGTYVTSGQGGVFVTAHLGCMELGRALARHEVRLVMNILVHTRHARQFNRVLDRLDSSNDVRLLEVTELGPATAVMLAERVAAGEFIAVAADRVPVSGSRTAQIDFLGHPARLPVGPYVLAGLLKCPLYLLACIREQGRYVVYLERLAERVELPRGRRDEALARYAEQYAQRLTMLLARSPYDWFNFFPFWDQADVRSDAP